jgi:hypothetical protein
MKALDALSEFNGFVAEHGKANEHLTPEDALTLMIDFYRDVRAEDCASKRMAICFYRVAGTIHRIR